MIWILVAEQFDVVTAFLNADLTDTKVYMQQPDGYVKYDDQGLPYVCILTKALHGLKQAPREWNQLLTAWLVKYGFTQYLADPGCLIITVDDHLYVLAVYVDDCALHLPNPSGVRSVNFVHIYTTRNNYTRPAPENIRIIRYRCKGARLPCTSADDPDIKCGS